MEPVDQIFGESLWRSSIHLNATAESPLVGSTDYGDANTYQPAFGSSLSRQSSSIRSCFFAESLGDRDNQVPDPVAIKSYG